MKATTKSLNKKRRLSFEKEAKSTELIVDQSVVKCIVSFACNKLLVEIFFIFLTLIFFLDIHKNFLCNLYIYIYIIVIYYFYFYNTCIDEFKKYSIHIITNINCFYYYYYYFI